ncbi:MAG: hypothetical protein ABH864_05590 [archaeon]
MRVHETTAVMDVPIAGRRARTVLERVREKLPEWKYQNVAASDERQEGSMKRLLDGQMGSQDVIIKVDKVLRVRRLDFLGRRVMGRRMKSLFFLSLVLRGHWIMGLAQ